MEGGVILISSSFQQQEMIPPYQVAWGPKPFDGNAEPLFEKSLRFVDLKRSFCAFEPIEAHVRACVARHFVPSLNHAINGRRMLLSKLGCHKKGALNPEITEEIEYRLTALVAMLL